MPARRTITNKVRAAARRNIRRAQLSRYRIREPRSAGRVRPLRYSIRTRVSGGLTTAKSILIGRKR